MIIKFKTKDNDNTGEAIEFTGADANWKQIEHWSDRSVAVKGTSLAENERSLEIQILGIEVRAEVGVMVLKMGDIFTFISKETFLRKYDITEGSLTRELSDVCNQYGIDLIIKWENNKWAAQLEYVMVYDNDGKSVKAMAHSYKTPTDALNALGVMIAGNTIRKEKPMQKVITLQVNGIESV